MLVRESDKPTTPPPIWAGLYIFLLMSERLAPSIRGGLSLSDGFPVSICQVRLCTARRSPLLSPGYLLPLSPAGSAVAPGPLPTTARRRGRLQGGSPHPTGPWAATYAERIWRSYWHVLYWRSCVIIIRPTENEIRFLLKVILTLIHKYV